MKVKDWLAAVESNPILENFPNLVCGWPDEDHGIHWEAYREACIQRIDDLTQGSDVPEFKTYTNWRRDMRDADPERDSLGFSWQVCDLCGALPGERYTATAFDTEMSEYCGLSVCLDCLCYIANGDLPEE